MLLNFLVSMVTIVLGEGYYCPFTDLGATENMSLLYDYYDTNEGYWTRKGEVGWTSVQAYCSDKGDSTKHSDAGEWKCNDSKGICFWTEGGCMVASSRTPDCKALCQAVLDNKGPACLGDCPGGKISNTLYDLCSDASATTTSMTPTTSILPTQRALDGRCFKTICSTLCHTNNILK